MRHRSQQQFDRQAAGIGQGVDFGAQPATVCLFARPKIPFRTRRASTRETPRGLFGSNDAITPSIQNPSAHILAKSSLPNEKLESHLHPCGIPFYEFMTQGKTFCLLRPQVNRISNDGVN